MNSETLKNIVKEKYSQIAGQSKQENEQSCCGVGGCATIDYAVFAEDYKGLDGYVEGADLGLGCGLPTEFAQIRAGQTILDLGSGAGNDCFVARSLVGPAGKVIGVDFTETMIGKARDNAEKLGFNNVEFRLGDIEQLPVAANRVDVVISNCVLNLVPDKAQAFNEMFRVLRPGGHFSVSDVVIIGDLPEALQHDAEMYAGCVSGAITKSAYLLLLQQTGFEEIVVQKQKEVILPAEVWDQYGGKPTADPDFGIYSITVFGVKPSCKPGDGCC
jgi:arsenite methyltransferase